MLEDLRHGRRMMRMMRGALELALVRTGLHAELFEGLREPATPAELARRLHLEPDLVAAFVRAAHAHGLLERDGESYRAGDYVRWLLESPSAPAAQAMLDQAALSYAPVLAGLPALMRGGERPAWGSAAQAERAARGSRFTAGRALAALDKVPGVRQARRILDVGCGIGADLVAFLMAYRDARAVGVELDPQVAETARQALREAEVHRRGEVLHGDFMGLELEQGGFDLALLNQNLHYFGGAERRALFERIRSHLRSGGILAIQTPVVEEGWASRAAGFTASMASFDLFLRAHSNLHGLPDPEALAAVLREVGFEEVGEVPIVPGGGLRYVWARAR